MIIKRDTFIKEIKEQFRFLTELGFDEIGFELSERDYYYHYLKNKLLVRIRFNLPNNWVEVRFIYNATNSDARELSDNSISLMTLLSCNKIYSYEDIMPERIGFSESVRLVAYNTECHAKSILSGESTITEQESLKITNPNRFK